MSAANGLKVLRRALQYRESLPVHTSRWGNRIRVKSWRGSVVSRSLVFPGFFSMCIWNWIEQLRSMDK